MSDRPTLMETALGAFLHDAGKLGQRAFAGVRDVSSHTSQIQGDLLPYNKRGGYHTHKHVLWTEEFFDWILETGTEPRAGIDWRRVRHVAVFHHKPESAVREIGAVAWIAAEADRLASGMDRKEKDAERELQAERTGWDAFIRTPLVSPFRNVSLGLGKPPRVELPLEELRPGAPLAPKQKQETREFRARYERLWNGFLAAIEPALSLANAAVLAEAVLSASERFLWCVPSSTVDEPDISLHDHARAAAAIAAALYRWHEDRGSLDDEAAVRDRDLTKFRFLAGDLSGIQSTLFRLRHQQVKGVNRVLRARSFLLGMITEAAALAARRALGLPVFSVVQNAGGRFLMLVADTTDCEEKVEGLRREIDGWIQRRYRGELALNLALTEPFAGRGLLRENLPSLMARLHQAIDEAKLRPFASGVTVVHRDADYHKRECTICGVRPAIEVERLEDESEVRRCEACRDENRLGREIPKVRWLSWKRGGEGGIGFFDGLRLLWAKRGKTPNEHGLESLVRVWSGRDTEDGAPALRFLASYVPVLEEAGLRDPRYDLVARERETSHAGEVKTFEHLAAAALEPSSDGGWKGEPFLAVLKADVDRLGLIFGRGLGGGASLGRLAGLSRSMDFFFTGQLYALLEESGTFRDTYTVYAGGDDLLLVGPWRQMLELARELRRRFAQWTGNNPNITLSAGIELMKVNHPVNRAADAAEQRLERAKGAGRDRICALAAEPVSWKEFEDQLDQADKLHAWLSEGKLSQVFVHRILAFDALRRRAEADGKKRAALDLDAAAWRARWGYQLARHVRANKSLTDSDKETITRTLNELLGLNEMLRREAGKNPSPRIAVSVALYRNRSAGERRS